MCPPRILCQFAMENHHEDYTQIIEQSGLSDLACEQTVYSLLMSPMMLAADQRFGESKTEQETWICRKHNVKTANSTNYSRYHHWNGQLVALLYFQTNPHAMSWNASLSRVQEPWFSLSCCLETQQETQLKGANRINTAAALRAKKDTSSDNEDNVWNAKHPRIRSKWKNNNKRYAPCSVSCIFARGAENQNSNLQLDTLLRPIPTMSCQSTVSNKVLWRSLKSGYPQNIQN